MKFLSKTAFLLLIFSIIPLNAQNYEARQKKLEAQKISLTKEISQINSLILDSRKKSKNLANELEDIQLKISVRDKLININNSQLNTHDISDDGGIQSIIDGLKPNNTLRLLHLRNNQLSDNMKSQLNAIKRYKKNGSNGYQQVKKQKKEYWKKVWFEI